MERVTLISLFSELRRSSAVRLQIWAFQRRGIFVPIFIQQFSLRKKLARFDFFMFELRCGPKFSKQNCFKKSKSKFRRAPNIFFHKQNRAISTFAENAKSRIFARRAYCVGTYPKSMCVCLCVRSSVRPFVRPFVRPSALFLITFWAAKMESSKGFGPKRRPKMVPRCQKCNADRRKVIIVRNGVGHVTDLELYVSGALSQCPSGDPAQQVQSSNSRNSS